MASELVSFLERALHIAPDEIFCSSIPGDGIPAGQKFVDYIKEQLKAPDVIVFLLLTDSYLKSVFALCEMGASWVLGVRCIPLMVPPLEHKDLTAVLTGVHVYNVMKPEDLGAMGKQLTDWLPTVRKTTDLGRWEHFVLTFTGRVREISNRPQMLPPEPAGPNDFEVYRAAEFYEKIAVYYDKGVSNDFTGTHTDLNRVIEGQLSAGNATNVLDLGGGTGRIFGNFDVNPAVAWHYCDACPAMLNVFSRNFGKSSVLREAVCQDAEEYLHKSAARFDIIILSFLISSMPHTIDFSLLKHRLIDDGLLIIVEANPTYSEKKPKFSIFDKSNNVKYSLKIRPMDAPSLSKSASLVGFKIDDLLSHNKGDQPYSYIAIFKKKWKEKKIVH